MRNLDGEGFCRLQPGLPRPDVRWGVSSDSLEVASRASSVGRDMVGGHHGSGLWGAVSFTEHLDLSSVPLSGLRCRNVG